MQAKVINIMKCDFRVLCKGCEASSMFRFLYIIELNRIKQTSDQTPDLFYDPIVRQGTIFSNEKIKKSDDRWFDPCRGQIWDYMKYWITETNLIHRRIEANSPRCIEQHKSVHESTGCQRVASPSNDFIEAIFFSEFLTWVEGWVPQTFCTVLFINA